MKPPTRYCTTCQLESKGTRQREAEFVVTDAAGLQWYECAALHTDEPTFGRAQVVSREDIRDWFERVGQ